MSIFNRNNIEGDLFKGSGGEFADHPEGTFSGKIAKVDLKKTQAGHRVLNVQVKTDKGSVFTGLNLDHPKCATITQQTIGQILDSYQEPPQKIETLDQMKDLISGLPVVVHVKHKGKSDKGYTQFGVYFNQLPAEQKVKLDGGAPRARVEY